MQCFVHWCLADVEFFCYVDLHDVVARFVHVVEDLFY